MELLGAMSALFEPRVDKVEVLDAGTAAVRRIDLTFKSRRSGRELATSAVEVYRVTDGKITHRTSTTRTQRRSQRSRRGEPRGFGLDIDAARALAWELMSAVNSGDGDGCAASTTRTCASGTPSTASSRPARERPELLWMHATSAASVTRTSGCGHRGRFRPAVRDAR